MILCEISATWGGAVIVLAWGFIPVASNSYPIKIAEEVRAFERFRG